MATVTGMTAAAMEAIADECIVNGSVDSGTGHLILTKQDSSTIDAGNVKGATGSTGATGATGADGTTTTINYLATNNPTSADWSNNSHKITGLTDGSSSGHAMTYNQGVKKAGDTMTGALAPAIFSLSFTTTILVNAALGNYCRVTLTASTGTLDAPSNPVDGQSLMVEITQDSTGSRTMAWNSAWKFSTALPAPTLSTAANSIDIVGFVYNATKSKWLCMGYVLGAD